MSDRETRALEAAYARTHGAPPLAIYPGPSNEHDAVRLVGILLDILGRFTMTLLDRQFTEVARLKVVGYSEGKLIGTLEGFQPAPSGEYEAVWCLTNGTILREVQATALVPGSTIRVEQPIALK